MTSTFDNLSVLFFDSTREQRIPQDLVLLVFAEAVKELDAVAPDRLTWDKWVNGGGIYAKLYREKKSPLIEAQANFVSTCHNLLDHSGYHNKCFSHDFLYLMDYVKLVMRHGLEEAEAWYTPLGISQRRWKKVRAKYQKIMQAFKEHSSEIKPTEPD